MAKKILITGGTGLIGIELRELLRLQGHDVRILSRSKKDHPHFKFFHWDVEKDELEDGALDVDIIVHLAGAGIADERWTDQRKRIIIDSRVETTRFLERKIRESSFRPGYIGASAIGIYGNQDEHAVTEDEVSADMDNFLVKVCHLWEDSHRHLEEVVGQWAIVRIGIVLSPNGGVLNKLLLPMKARTANYFGDGSQVFSWIHIKELCRIFSFLIENQVSGIYNGVAPNPVNGKEMIDALTNVKSGPYLKFGVPEKAIEVMFGEMSTAILASTKVSSEKIQEKGFKFEFEKVRGALEDLVA
ncbi:TIGR01777 family oxidoreductase [Portibacter marinus]|uniref:TIGR01777 family oxidoreductase n=1 Tax=Portibacter marinus TaxID=2898660 RepID=UPI001F170389|nr:TIGR01777 family oxidoreductase [Portibacter marinus]